MRPRDFDAEWKRMERSGRRAHRMAVAVIGLAWLLVIAILVAVVWLIVTTSPEEAGGWFGRVAHGFHNGSRA